MTLLKYLQRDTLRYGVTDFNNKLTWTLFCYLQRDTSRYKATDNNTTLLLLFNVTRDASMFLAIDRMPQPYILLRHFQVHGCNKTSQLIPVGISNITELTLDLFDNNYHLYAHKISCSEDGLFIRAIVMKNNEIILNYTYKIIGTDNVQIATIVSADQVCNHYLLLATKGDTFLCSLGDGHLGVHASIIRNAHLANFIRTLNKIKLK